MASCLTGLLALVVAGSRLASTPVPPVLAVAVVGVLFLLAASFGWPVRSGLQGYVQRSLGAIAVAFGLVLVPAPWLIPLSALAVAMAGLCRSGDLMAVGRAAGGAAAGVGLAVGAALIAGFRGPAAYSPPMSTGWLDWVSGGQQFGLLVAVLVLATWTAVSTGRRVATGLLTGLGTAAVALGVLVLARYRPFSLAALPPALLCCYAAYRSYTRVRQEREASDQLALAIHELSRLEEAAALAAALGWAAQLFRARYVEIALYADAGTGSVARWLRGDAGGIRGEGAEYVPASAGARIAPLRTPGRQLGELRLGFDGPAQLTAHADRMLSTFAYSVSSTVLSARLFEQTRAKAERAAYEACHDDLTDLANRTLLQQRADQAINAAGDRSVCAVLLLDIVHFREVNETLGHDAGDDLLREIATRLSAVARRTDTPARIGGNEFALLLTDLREQAGADVVAARLLHALAAPVTLQGLALSVEASLGLACSPHDATSAAQLLRCAEVAAHHAKTDPGSVQRYRSDRDASSTDRLALVGELRTALDEQQLILYFQPKVELARGRVVGAEALVRWHHPRRGLLEPAEFVPTMESSGLVGAFTEHVLELAIAECAAWPAAGGVPSVAVNLSSRNLLDTALPARIAATLARCALPAHRLILEITETMMMSELETVDEVLAALVDLGVQTSVDDFGTGYSSLTFLSRVNVDEVKIDRGFVGSMLDSAGDAAIVRATVDLAHSFGLRVVAEGVESAAQQQTLTTLGCDMAQGNYLGRPLPAAAFRALLATSHALTPPPVGPRIPLPSPGRDH